MPKFNTIADFPPDRFSITAHCEACGHSHGIDTDKLPLDLPMHVLQAHARCTACGAKGASLRIAYSASMDISSMIGRTQKRPG